jgi:hypothetical protein
VSCRLCRKTRSWSTAWTWRDSCGNSWSGRRGLYHLKINIWQFSPNAKICKVIPEMCMNVIVANIIWPEAKPNINDQTCIPLKQPVTIASNIQSIPALQPAVHLY